MEGQIFIGIVALIIFIFFLKWLLYIRSKAKKYDELKKTLDYWQSEEADLRKRQNELESNIQSHAKKIQSDIEAINTLAKQQTAAINTLAKEKSHGFPWLSQAYADYFHLQDLKKAKNLKRKSHPAPRAAEQVREIATQRRTAEKLHRILKYQLEYYENLFPWLVEFKSEDIDDLIRNIMDKKTGKDLEEPDDPAKIWLTAAEYHKLPRVEKYQLALDRYWKKKKRKREIGRDYERYIGYLYEKSGFGVYYQGIVAGLEDLGRDLIARKGSNIEIIQCKCWSTEKTIHEKHIFQLFGTTVEYWLKDMENQKTFQSNLFPELQKEKSSDPSLLPELLVKERVKAKFVTSTKLSEKAKEFAKALKVDVVENFPLQSYPSVKCNVARRTGEKIYHLPFDQQYDRTLIEDERNECYVATVKEAEELGFRKAFRWRGRSSE